MTETDGERPLRVLLTASTFPLEPGDGLPRFVYDLAQALSAHCEVTALVPDAPGAAPRERMGDVDVRRFRYFAPRSAQRLAYGAGIADNLRASWLARLQPPAYVLALAHATRRLARELRADVVNSHWLVPQGLAVALARGGRARFPHVATLHGGDAYLLTRLPLGGALSRFVVSRSDAVFAVASNVRERLDTALGRASEAVIQPVGVHVDRFRARHPAPPSPFEAGYLLFVGRFIEIKGVETLIRALPRVRAAHPGLGLVLAGYGPREAAYRDEARRCGVADAVHLPGRQTHDQIVAWLQGCRAAVVPSRRLRGGRSEGMPSVVLEALAAGAPLVATRTGGISDVVRHAENGWLCADNDPDALAEALLRALADAAPEETARRARETADRFDWSAVAGRYLETFERLARAGSPGSLRLATPCA